MSSFRSAFMRAIAGALLTALLAEGTRAAEPLHVRIDAAIAALQVGPASPVAGEAEFLRRIYLDLTGEIPSAADVRAFMADASSGKRVAAVDRLLASPNYVRHMANIFSV